MPIPTLDAPLVHALIAATDPETGSADRRRRHHQRPVDLHAGRPRHDRDGTHLRAVGAGAPPRRAGPCRRGGCGDRRPRDRHPTTCPGSATPCRCCTRRCGCVRPPRGSAGWLTATSRWTDTGSRRAASCWWESMRCTEIRTLWPEPLGLRSRPVQPRGIEGSRPLAVHPVRRRLAVHASANTSRGWRPPWRWPPSSRAMEIRSLDDEFPVDVPFTTVAKGPIGPGSTRAST